MTQKTGLFDVDLTLSTKELNASIKGEGVTCVRYKPFTEAVRTIVCKMEVSGYRHVLSRIMIQCCRTSRRTYLEEITVVTIYLWLESMQVVNQT